MEGSASDIRRVWSLNHILVMPSLNEGMPLSVVEAMLCGRPVVTTDVGGNTEWITDGEEGFIADGANTRSLDAALEAAWQRRDEWSAIGLKAHERALALHDPDAGGTLLRLILEHGRRT
jgi:glycosyltransferase involved in cell wall biosynthesis